MTFEEGAKIVLSDCMGAHAGERLLVVTDTEKQRIGEALFEAGIGSGLESTLMVMKPTGTHGKEPTESVAEAMRLSDIVLCPTAFSLTHTKARKRACKDGARIATMPNITEDMFTTGAILADYTEVARLSDLLTDLLSQAAVVRIEKGDTLLEIPVKGRAGVSSNGRFLAPGAGGNLPTGEAYIAPLEGAANGETIIDGSIAGIGVVAAPLRVVIRDGRATEFIGPYADRLREILGENPDAYNLGELGIGTNQRARLIGNILEDEKVYGTAHIAFGSNATFGGTVQAGVHIDGVMLSPEVYLDDRLVVSEGKLLI
ncbi:MAG: aminopeptidase [Spirochaetales bacterium]|nr:aminopeptidase [Spirochaetales bacterium]